MTVLAEKKKSKFEHNLGNLREVMGIMQHHDAVSGTEKQHVANDYARLLQIGFDKCSENIKESLNQLTIDDYNSEIPRVEGSDPKISFDYANCADLNISSCFITEDSEKFVVTLYNPLAHSTFQYVRVPVSDGEYQVLDYRNVSVSSQLVSIPDEVQSLTFRQSNAQSELVFLANEIPPLGYKSYYIRSKSKREIQPKSIEPIVIQITKRDVNKQSGQFTIGNKFLNFTFDENGLLNAASTEEVQMKVRQNFYLYHGFNGNNEEFKNRSSGAYIFRPDSTQVHNIVSRADVKVIRGDLVDEVHQVKIVFAYPWFSV